jgi:hypothetical protein
VQASFYERFVQSHPEATISMRAFECLKPFFVKKCKDRNVCCCKYHVEIDMLREAINTMRDAVKGVHSSNSCTCSCPVCYNLSEDSCCAHLTKCDGVTKFWEQIVCPKGEADEFHKLDCLMGSCSKCGAHTLLLCPLEVSGPSMSMKWRCFSYEVVGVNDDGEPRKRISEVFMETSCVDFFEYLKPKLQEFVSHNFVARWQDVQCRLSMKELPADAILSHVDFAENYSFEIQNEIQSMHWHSSQITILVHITYRLDALTNSMVKESHFYLSDDKTHDTLFVQHCFLQHWEWLKGQGVNVARHWVWSDGCAGQFKGSRPMYFVSRYPGLTGGCVMSWNFFGTGHGKGEWDGAGAVVKRALRTEQLHNPWRKLQDAKDAVDFLKETMEGVVESSLGGNKRVSYRFFHLIEPTDVDRRHLHGCDTIAGSRKLHSVQGVSISDPTLLMVRQLSCFCIPCMDGDWANCEKMAHVQPWRVIKLVPTDVSFVREQMISQQAEDGDDEPWDYVTEETLGDLVDAGDNFAVPAIEGNAEGVDFYILQCQRRKQIVREKFTCIWGGQFEVGEYVIAGTYYQKWGNSPNSYVYLRNSRVAYIDASLVIACRFQMVPAAHRVKGDEPVYQLLSETIDVIRTSLEAL